VEVGEVQDMNDILPALLTASKEAKVPTKFHMRVELGDGKTRPSEDIERKINELLKKVKEDFELR